MGLKRNDENEAAGFGWLNAAAELDAAAGLDGTLDMARVDRVTAGLRRQRDAGTFFHIGYPVASDMWDELDRLDDKLGPGLWNNIGSLATDSPGGNHTKPTERALLDWAGDLFGFPADDRWGYVTRGGTDGNLAGLHAARNYFPRNAYGLSTALTYYCASAHNSIVKCLEMLAMPAVRVRADARGEMDYAHLDELLAAHSDRPAIVLATAGTTVTEAVDDLTRIAAALDRHHIEARQVVLDAALSGIPLALDGALDLANVDVVAISGYKFLGVDQVCGIVLGRHRHRRDEPYVDYTDTLDGTLAGSRDGKPAHKMWYVVATRGNDGHRARAHAARELAHYAVDQIRTAGWKAWRHPHAFTVVFPTPPPLPRPWVLANTTNGISHLITMPGVTIDQIDAFARDLRFAVAAGTAPLIPSARLPEASQTVPTLG